MFTRARWFTFGALVTLGIAAFVVNRARVMKENLTLEGIARASATLAADTIGALGTRLQRSALRDVSSQTDAEAS